MSDNPAIATHRPMLPYLNMRTKPEHISPELAYEIAAIVIEWGSFENAISIDLEQLRNWPVVKSLCEKVPLGFEKKIELWKRSVCVLFPSVKLYKNQAVEICSKGKVVARQRHRLIHGLWQADNENAGEFRVLSGFDRQRQFGYLKVNLEFARALHSDVRAMKDAVWSFLITRASHATEGRLVPVSLSGKQSDTEAI